tara:strand:+ start:908 stop:1177 length:270 start_codon:yes stop_codon:yes gene_type:complete
MEIDIIQLVGVNSWYAAIPVLLLFLNQGLKKFVAMPSKYAVLVNWGVGIGLGILLAPVGTSIVVACVAGFLAGSAASGIYDGHQEFIKN